MMDKNAIKWLYRQLPELVSQGVLTQEGADRLKQYYGPVEAKTPAKTLLTAFGVIGAVLVGLGVILILAHNWSSLTRVNRLIIAIGLLIAAQALTGTALFFKRNGDGWREAAAVLHMLMLGASMALVSQTYHLTDDTDAFLLVWMLLSLPLIYLAGSNGVCLLYLTGITAWTFTSHIALEKQLVWALLLLALPYLRRQLRQNPRANATRLLTWTLNICFYFCFAAAFGPYIDKYGMLIYSCLFSINYMLSLQFQSSSDPRRLPLKIISLAGGAGLTFMLTAGSLWRGLIDAGHPGMAEIILVTSLLLLAAAGNILLLRQQAGKILTLSLSPLIVSAAYLLQAIDQSGVSSAVLMNGYLFALSIGIVIFGIRSHGIALANIGMLLLAAVIIARFLDSGFSFIIRGMVFVLLGAGFLITNLVMTRRGREDLE